MLLAANSVLVGCMGIGAIERMADLFFPNQPESLLKQERRVRAIAGSLTEYERLELYSALSALVPTLEPTMFRVEDDVVIATQSGQEIAFPRPLPLIKHCLVAFGYEEWLRRKYCLPGFVEVQPGDIVIDCGSYVGGFALSAAKTGAEVHAFEPERGNAACALRNLRGFDNVRVLDQGLYCRSGEMVLNVSSSSVEHSLLQPDDDVVVETRRIPVVSLADYASANNIERLDFVKIEAEGVELEVFAGLGQIRPRQLAIDVSPERDGKSPSAEFWALLEPLGYEVRQRGQVLFARL